MTIRTQARIAGQVPAVSDPLALRLDIALPDTVPLLGLHDLDNFLFPLVSKLTGSTGRQFASVWATTGKPPARTDQASPISSCYGTTTASSASS
jgi:hypothetical protein